MELIRATVEHHAGISVFAGIGERSREGHELLLELQRSGVLARTALVFGQLNEPPGARWRTGLAALTLAEYVRDREHENVLLLVDNVYRLSQARSAARQVGKESVRTCTSRWSPYTYKNQHSTY